MTVDPTDAALTDTEVAACKDDRHLVKRAMFIRKEIEVLRSASLSEGAIRRRIRPVDDGSGG